MEKVIGISTFLLLVLTATLACPQEQLPEPGFPIAKETQSTKVTNIRGIVIDENGALIPKAEIVLRRFRAGYSSEIFHTETDSEGRFQLRANKGTYEVEVRRFGFKDKRVPIEVSRKGRAGFKVQMIVETVVMVN